MLSQGILTAVYAFSWLIFAVCAMVFNGLCAVLLLLPRSQRAPCGMFARRTLHYFFRAWLTWTRWCGIVKVRWHGFAGIPLREPAVWVANHPGLIDSTFLIALLPDAFCIFKPAVLGNPFFAPAAVLAEFTPGDLSPMFVRDAVRKLTQGRVLIVFPEGTRTDPTRDLNPLKPGFALIAAHAGVPVQVVVIHANRDLLPRGRPWWRPPHFPVLINVEADVRIPPFESDGARQVLGTVQSRLASALNPVRASVSA